MAQQQQQQVIYLVMDENNQGQQIQFINGQPTIVMDEPAAGALENPAEPGSQVLLVSEDGQLVTGNEGQVLVDDSGQVVMTNDEGQQVALETEHLNVSQPIQYLVSEAPTSKTNILSQAASVITGSKATNGDKDDGYTTIMIGADTPASQPASSEYVQPTTSITHPILSTQLGASPSLSPVKPSKSGAESPRTMVSILDKARLASLSQQQPPKQEVEEPTAVLTTGSVVESELGPSLNGVGASSEVLHVEERSPEISLQDDLEEEKPEEIEQEPKVEVPLAAEIPTVVAKEEKPQLPHVTEAPPAGKVSTEEAKDLVKSLDEYICKKAEESSSSVEAKLKPEQPAENTGPVASGTMLGPFHDSDESGPEPFDEVSSEAPVTTIIKPTEKEPTVQLGGEDSGRRKSVRNKSPKRYSEEPIIFGDDWTKKAESKSDKPDQKRSPSPHKRGFSPRGGSESDAAPLSDQKASASPPRRGRSPKGETSESDAADQNALPSPPRKGRSPRGETSESDATDLKASSSPPKRGRSPKGETSESDAAALSEAEQKVPPKKRLSRTASITEESQTKTEELTPRKRGRPPKKRFLEKHNSQEAGEVREKRERRLRGEAKQMYDSFGFNDDSEKEEETAKTQNKKSDVLLIQKPTESPVILAVDTPIVTHLPTAPKNKFESPVRDNIKIVTSTPTVVKASQDKPSPKLTDVKPAKAQRPLGISSGDRKVGIDVKNMKFSVSKKTNSSTPLSQKLLSHKKITPGASKTPKSSSVEDKDLATREAALAKRERKMRALDLELDERTAQLKAKEGKLDRWEHKLYELESTLDAREKKISRQEKGGSKRKSTMSSTDEKELKEWEGRLKKREKDLQAGERELVQRENQLSGLKKELAKKYEALEDSKQQSTGPRQGLFERLADLSTESHDDPVDEEPATKKAKKDTPIVEKKVEVQKKEATEDAPKRGRGRPPKQKVPANPAPESSNEEEKTPEEATNVPEGEEKIEKEKEELEKEEEKTRPQKRKREPEPSVSKKYPERIKKSVPQSATRVSRMRVAAKQLEKRSAKAKPSSLAQKKKPSQAAKQVIKPKKPAPRASAKKNRRK